MENLGEVISGSKWRIFIFHTCLALNGTFLRLRAMMALELVLILIPYIVSQCPSIYISLTARNLGPLSLSTLVTAEQTRVCALYMGVGLFLQFIIAQLLCPNLEGLTTQETVHKSWEIVGGPEVGRAHFRPEILGKLYFGAANTGLNYTLIASCSE